MAEFVFKNVRLIDDSTLASQVSDIYVVDGYVSESVSKYAEVYDLNGCFASLGWLDIGVQFSDPGLEQNEDIFSGLASAAYGGFTDVLIWPNTDPVIQKKGDIEYVLSKSRGSATHLHVAGAISKDALGESFNDLMDMHFAGAKAFSDGLAPLYNSDLLVKSLQYLQSFNGLVITKPTDRWLSMFGQMHEGTASTMLGMKGIPSIAEDIIIGRDIDLLRYAGGRLHFSNISTIGAVNRIRAAKTEGLKVSCDVAIANLVYTDEALKDFDTNYKVFPPLRSSEDRMALIAGINDGTIDCITSGHLPCDNDTKKMEFDLADPGMNNMPVFYSIYELLKRDIPLETFISCVSYKSRKIIGLATSGIKIGDKACFTFFNPSETNFWGKENNPSKSINSPFYNKRMNGKVWGIYNNNKLIINT